MTPTRGREKSPMEMQLAVNELQSRMDAVEKVQGIMTDTVTQLKTFMDESRAAQRERDKLETQRHAENVERLEKINQSTARKTLWATVVGVLWTIAGVSVMVLTIWVMVRLADNKSSVLPLPVKSMETAPRMTAHAIEPVTRAAGD